MPVFQSDFGRVCSSHCSASARPALITPVRIPKRPTPLSWLADVSYFQPYRPTQMSLTFRISNARISMPDQAPRLLSSRTLIHSHAVQTYPVRKQTRHWENSWNSETDELISCNGCLRKKIFGSFLAGPARFFSKKMKMSKAFPFEKPLDYKYQSRYCVHF